MFTPELIATAFYGLISIVGGVIGYWKSQSKISLVSGIISGLLLFILSIMMYLGNQSANFIAAIIVSLLIIVFIFRWLKTKKLIPALPMILLGFISLIFILN